MATFRRFDEDMREVQKKLLRLGALAERMFSTVIRLLVYRKDPFPGRLDDWEREVNDLQVEVDEAVVAFTARYQPVARDVRFLYMASRIATDLERVADLAINIRDKARELERPFPLPPVSEIPRMAVLARRMLRESLDSFLNRNCDLAERVLRTDAKVDATRDLVHQVFLERMQARPEYAPSALAWILISRNMERVADHATNIAEETIYLVQGRDVRHRNNVHNQKPTGDHRPPAR